MRAKLRVTKNKHPQARIAPSLEAVLHDDDVLLVAAAAITSERGPLGMRVMQAGKDYFTDKCPFTTLAQLGQVREFVKQSKQKYMVYYSERLHVECAVYAGQLIREGVIGRVLQVLGLGRRVFPFLGLLFAFGSLFVVVFLFVVFCFAFMESQRNELIT